MLSHNEFTTQKFHRNYLQIKSLFDKFTNKSGISIKHRYLTVPVIKEIYCDVSRYY